MTPGERLRRVLEYINDQITYSSDGRFTLMEPDPELDEGDQDPPQRAVIQLRAALKEAPEGLDVKRLREALIHLVTRRHEHSEACDGCAAVKEQVRAALRRDADETLEWPEDPVPAWIWGEEGAPW